METLFQVRDEQTGFEFPIPLAEKYRPRRIEQFAGLEKIKRILLAFSKRPTVGAFLFVGPPGVGKTTMGLALAEAIRAEVHHIPSQKCNLEAVDAVASRCWFVPMLDTYHLVLVDEADCMSQAAQQCFLSKLDSTQPPPKTIWIFTCNSTDGLEPRFLSRCRVLEFSKHGLFSELVILLRSIWKCETAAPEPDLEAIARDAHNNVRDALMRLELEIMAAA